MAEREIPKNSSVAGGLVCQSYSVGKQPWKKICSSLI